MQKNIEAMSHAVEDLGDAMAIAQRGLERLHSELAQARAEIAGQAELPPPVGCQAGTGERPTRGTLQGIAERIEDGIEAGDATRALAAVRELRGIVDGLTI